MVSTTTNVKYLHHQEHLLSEMHLCQQDETFIDVNIICEGEIIPAHKLILGAASHFLRLIFQEQENEVITLILPDVKVAAVQALLAFLYTGKWCVREDQVRNIQEVASLLHMGSPAPQPVLSTTIPPVQPTTDADSNGLNVPLNPELPVTVPLQNPPSEAPPFQGISQFEMEVQQPNLAPSTVDFSGVSANQCGIVQQTEDMNRVNPLPSEIQFRVYPKLQTQDINKSYLEEKKLYSCNMCLRQFQRSNHLHNHLRSAHTGEKPYMCPTCGKQFARKDDAKRHAKIHMSDSKYTCSICGKQYSRQDRLKRHMEVHSTGNPSCDICSKQFTDISDMKRHRLIHTKEKLFCCEHCGKSFIRLDGCKRHMIVHTKNKPH